MRVALVKFEPRPATRISVKPVIDLSEQAMRPGAVTVLHFETIQSVALGHDLVVGLRPDAVVRPDFLGVRLHLVRDALADEELTPRRSRWRHHSPRTRCQ